MMALSRNRTTLAWFLVGTLGSLAAWQLGDGRRERANARDRSEGGEFQEAGLAEEGLAVSTMKTEAPSLRDGTASASETLPSEPSSHSGAGLTPELVLEGQAMAELRSLWPKEPQAALARAGELDERFARGPGAAERRWISARCLTDLGRHEEAAEVARRLVAEHAASHWANDAERHLLVHPLGLPSREQSQLAERARERHGAEEP